MSDFFPDQRYTTDGEPELGIGILKEVSRRQVQIYFPSANETRIYATESAPLRRVVFKKGDTIVDTQGTAMIVEDVQLMNSLYEYYGDNKTLTEAELGNVSITHSVDDRLFNGDVDSPAMFALRRQTHYHNYNRRISAVNGFVGGKIDLIPHQLYIAHEVSSRYAPRVLLSDQVGLGKTIEACLILHRLLVSERISRVMILVPESLIHQWFVEVLRKFNLWFNIFDEERCAALEEGAPEGNPFLDDQLVICSIEFLAASKKRTMQAISANWDMLVVDEAHHLEWSVDKVSPEYSIVELLSKVAKGLLLLTATPEQLGAESHFARLRLLDPNRYSNYQDFVSESSDHKPIANIVAKLSAGDNLLPEELELLHHIFPEERIEALAKGYKTDTDNLIENLLDQHGPGRVLFRNTRSAMKGFPKRIPNPVQLDEIKDRELWIERLTDEFNADMKKPSNSDDKPTLHLNKDPRVDWLLKKLEEIAPEKVLLICTTKEKVLALEAALNEHTNGKVGVFHEDLTLIQRDRNSAWFADSESAQILLCSEIGSEGRNFQFVHHLVLFDLPDHPELLEQRIGRLDRIGQTHDIHIHIPFVEGSPQQTLVRWYHEGLNAFGTNLEGGNIISKRFRERLLSLSEENPQKNAELEDLIKETFEFQKSLRENLAAGRDKLLEMNSFRPQVAHELIEQIQAEDKDRLLETYLTQVFGHFGVEMEDLAARTYLLQTTALNATLFPSIPREGAQVTFDRKRSLRREDVSFLSWDHPITTGAIDMVLSSSTGNASFGVMRGTGSPALLLELLFVLETGGKQSTYVDRFLPNTPIRIVVDHTGKEVTEIYSVDMFNKSLIASSIDPLLDNDAFVDSILPNMISSATKIAQDYSAAEISKGIQQMTKTLNHEIERLEALQKMNPGVRPEEIEIAREEQSSLSTIIQNARIRLDALQLVRKE